MRVEGLGSRVEGTVGGDPGPQTLDPWAAMLRVAVQFGIMPEAFWRLSLREWRMLTAGEAQPVMGRAEFERMLEAYGDGS